MWEDGRCDYDNLSSVLFSQAVTVCLVYITASLSRSCDDDKLCMPLDPCIELMSRARLIRLLQGAWQR
jgi:hypothetical protein